MAKLDRKIAATGQALDMRSTWTKARRETHQVRRHSHATRNPIDPKIPLA